MSGILFDLSSRPTAILDGVDDQHEADRGRWATPGCEHQVRTPADKALGRRPVAPKRRSTPAHGSREEIDDGRRDTPHSFILTPRGASDPKLIGTEVVRHVVLDGDLAVFNTPTTPVDGVDVTTYIVAPGRVERAQPDAAAVSVTQRET